MQDIDLKMAQICVETCNNNFHEGIYIIFCNTIKDNGRSNINMY